MIPISPSHFGALWGKKPEGERRKIHLEVLYGKMGRGRFAHFLTFRAPGCSLFRKGFFGYLSRVIYRVLKVGGGCKNKFTHVFHRFFPPFIQFTCESTTPTPTKLFPSPCSFSVNRDL